jgi:hypothetical protein
MQKKTHIFAGFKPICLDFVKRTAAGMIHDIMPDTEELLNSEIIEWLHRF